MRITEGNVVNQLRKRNERALYYVIDEYSGLIKSIIRKHLYGIEDVHEECMDDILLAIWNHVDKFCEEKNSFKNWLAAIAKYKAIDYRRKYCRLPEQHDVEMVYIESPMNVENAVMDRAIRNELEKMLDNLKREDKELFIKHYIEEQSVDTIARERGVKSSVIYNRLSRGRKKLRSIVNLSTIFKR